MKRARVQQSKKKNKTDKNKTLRIIIISVVSFILVAFTVVDALQFKKEIGDFLNTRTTEQPEGEDNALADVTDGQTKINVLVLGLDKDGLRSDTIMLISYDMEAQTVNLMSIPRDTRMYVGSHYQKINAAYSTRNSEGEMRGAHGTIEAVTRLTGIPVHYYVDFTFDTFKETVDILGGIEFDVPQRMKYSDPYQDLYIDLQPGLQMLDGDKAEQLVRFRSYPRGDIQRIETQQAFLKAIIEQKLNADVIDKIPEMFDMVKDNIKTNFTPMEVAKYGMSLMSLPPENIKMYNLPGRFSEDGEYEASYWIAKMEKKSDSDEEMGIKELVSEVFGYPEEAQGATTGPKKGEEGSSSSSNSSKKTDSSSSSKKQSTNTTTDNKSSDKSKATTDTDSKKSGTDQNNSSKNNNSTTEDKKSGTTTTETEKSEDKKSSEPDKTDTDTDKSKTDSKSENDSASEKKEENKKTDTDTDKNTSGDDLEIIEIPETSEQSSKSDKSSDSKTSTDTKDSKNSTEEDADE